MYTSLNFAEAQPERPEIVNSVLFVICLVVLQPGLAKVQAPISQKVKGVGGEYAEGSGRVRQLQQAFHRISSFDGCFDVWLLLARIGV